jgi:hypothetical protein
VHGAAGARVARTKKAERLPPNEARLSLAVLGTMLGRESAAIEEPIGPMIIEEHERRKPTGRKPLPEYPRDHRSNRAAPAS